MTKYNYKIYVPLVKKSYIIVDVRAENKTKAITSAVTTAYQDDEGYSADVWEVDFDRKDDIVAEEISDKQIKEGRVV